MSRNGRVRADSVGRFCREIPVRANQKNYFLISPTYVNNASQLIMMVLTAKASGEKIRFFEDSAIDSVGCYVKGVWISD